MADPDPISTLRTRATLLFRLRDWSDEASWQEFYGLYHNFIYGLARRGGLEHADAEEVTQDVFRKVAETIHTFESDPNRGTFRGWLATVTGRRVTDKHRAKRPDQRAAASRPPGDEERTRTIERLPDTSASAHPWLDATAEDEEWQKHVLAAALARLARKVSAKHFQIFDLHTCQAWPALRIARELSVNPATVYVISHRLKKQLKLEVGRIETELR